jgi:serine/threonine-protein kinase
MNAPKDLNQTVDVPSVEADSLDAGLAAGFGRAEPPRSSLGDLRPVLLKEPDGESTHIVLPNSDAVPPSELAGDRYQFHGEIARGGMGAVLRARDVDLCRELAIKVLLHKHVTRPEVVSRFLEEARIGGQLQHPGVVPVYDIGRFGGRPFFTMKLVKGKTLAQLLAGRADPGDDRPRFITITLQITQTLAYAHAKGVIHRDLKPANVMVGSYGEVQVMDWGLAKVLAEGGVADEQRASRHHQPDEGTRVQTARSGTAETEAGSLLGTPAYMPPEQANGEVTRVDRRADVFGLGAILCEVLTGKPPYVARSGEEVRRKATNGDLADANARLGGCGADAELIALARACLAPEAIDRPKDAQEVADALMAYLDGVQDRLHQAELAEVEARAKAAEEAKRRRLMVALAGTALLALMLGGGGWLWVKTEREARSARVTRDVNDALNRAAALRARAASASAGAALLFAQAREQAQRALALVEAGPADPALKDQVRNLQTELDHEENDRRLVAALDEARLAQAETLSENRFADERAVPLFRQAFGTYGLPAGQGEAEAVAERIRNRPPAVRDAIVAALDEWDDLAGNPELGIKEPHREWLRAVLEAAESEDGWSRKVRAARAEKDPAKRKAALEALAREADPSKVPALALTRLARRLRPAQAVDLLRRAQQVHPADFWVNHDLGMALREVKPPERDEAVRFLTATVALRPESPGAHCNLGQALRGKGQLDAALASYQKALALDPKYAAALCNLGVAQADKGQLDAAIASFKKAIDLDPKAAKTHCNLGVALANKGQVDAALARFTQAITLDPTLADAHNNLGVALRGKGQLDAAIASFTKAIALDPKLANVHKNLGLAQADKGQLDAALASFTQAIDLDPKDTQAHYNLGIVQANEGQLDAAIARFTRAITLDPKLATAHDNLGVALARKGQLDAALARFTQAITLDPTLATAHCNLGHALKGQGRFAEALVSFRRGHEMGTKRPGWPYPSAAWVHEAANLAALEVKLTAFLQGSFSPTDAAQRLGLVTVCQAKKLHAAAVRLSADAFAADPKLAADLRAAHRYNAACFAAMAASGQGEDARKLKGGERLELRRRALTWLRADLAAYTRLHDGGPSADRPFVQQRMTHWQMDPDLAGLRDAAALAKLPTEERAACAKLWAGVAALLKKAQAPSAMEDK